MPDYTTDTQPYSYADAWTRVWRDASGWRVGYMTREEWRAKQNDRTQS